MRHIDLFSGIGGFALAATWVWGDDYDNVGHSEIESYPCKVYHRHFPESECLGDITKIDWSRFAGTIDLVTGGFPCQPHSVAGKRQGSSDERDLWSECVRAIRELRPRFALFENVAGLFTSNGGQFFNRVLSDISESGYDCEWQVLSAAEVGAWHKRERVWILSYPCDNGNRGRRGQTGEAQGVSSVDRQTGLSGEFGGAGEVFPDTDEVRLQRERTDDNSLGQVMLCDRATPDSAGEGLERPEREKFERGRERLAECGTGETCDTEVEGLDGSESEGDTSADVRPAEHGQGGWQADWWATEPCLGQLVDGLSAVVDLADGGAADGIEDFITEEMRGYAIRVATGVPKRVDQLKGLGNAIVPQCAAVIMQKIKENM